MPAIKLVIGLGNPHSAGVVVDHQGQRQKDEDQGLVISRSDSNVMQNIAVESGGFYLPFDNNNAANTGVKTVANKLSELQGQKQDDKTIRKANELYQFFLAFGFLCLLLRFFLGERKKERSHKALLNATLVLPLLTFTLQAQQGATNGQEAKPTQQAKPLQLSPEGKKQFEAFSEKEKKETEKRSCLATD